MRKDLVLAVVFVFIVTLYPFALPGENGMPFAEGYDFLRRERNRVRSPERVKPVRKEREPVIDTRDLAPACVILWVDGVMPGKRWVMRTAAGNVPILGVTFPDPESPDGEKALSFLRETVEGRHVKVCHPRMLAISKEAPRGIVYIEPVLESLQEILVRKGLARVVD